MFATYDQSNQSHRYKINNRVETFGNELRPHLKTNYNSTSNNNNMNSNESMYLKKI